MASQRNARPEGYPEQPQNQTQTQPLQVRQQQSGAFGSENLDSPGTGETAEQPPLSQMSERDRFGLAGLFRMIHSESPDIASLAIGQDLMSLGLDLNHPEYVCFPLTSISTP
jgi:CCR4-NOT transcription complex subunit 2